MDRNKKLKLKNIRLIAAKRRQQAKSRALVMSGLRSQESMFLIAPSIARAAIVKHRVISFD